MSFAFCDYETGSHNFREKINRFQIHAGIGFKTEEVNRYLGYYIYRNFLMCELRSPRSSIFNYNCFNY